MPKWNNGCGPDSSTIWKESRSASGPQLRSPRPAKQANAAAFPLTLLHAAARLKRTHIKLLPLPPHVVNDLALDRGGLDVRCSRVSWAAWRSKGKAHEARVSHPREDDGVLVSSNPRDRPPLREPVWGGVSWASSDGGPRDRTFPAVPSQLRPLVVRASEM